MFLFLVSSDPGVANNIARRRGALVVLNCLLAVLFHLGNFPQVKALLQSVDQLESQSNGDANKGVFGPCGHIKSEVTKILYYQARVKLYGGLEQASFNLFAQVAERLPPLKTIVSARPIANPPIHRNKTRALFYLCINAILCGIVPDIDGVISQQSDPFLYGILSPIVDSINQGSPTRLHQVLSSTVIQSTLQSRSVYLQVKQMYLLTVLVAIRRIHSLLTELGLDSSRMDIKCIAQVVKTLDQDAVALNKSRNRNSNNSSSNNTGSGTNVNNNNNNNNNSYGSTAEDHDANNAVGVASPHDELICGYSRGGKEDDDVNNLGLIVDLGQLIQLGWMKGYVAFEHGILVLSKANPFPRRVAS